MSTIISTHIGSTATANYIDGLNAVLVDVEKSIAENKPSHFTMQLKRKTETDIKQAEQNQAPWQHRGLVSYL